MDVRETNRRVIEQFRAGRLIPVVTLTRATGVS
jgi:hypothetical protein